jgi:hypothetical protein
MENSEIQIESFAINGIDITAHHEVGKWNCIF